MGPHGELGDIEARISSAMLGDRRRFLRRLAEVTRLAGLPNRQAELVRGASRLEALTHALAADVASSCERRARRQRDLPRPTYPDDLPVAAHKDEIARAIVQHQVIVVCGETGSGKTTQLPKICLEIGRGVDGFIGHTQPRRIAARSLSERIASELQTDVGGAVGYKIRFTDRVGAGTYVKLMTDGILLAETQHDRLLEQYDTILIDEAHERSLNIDFLLGYLKQLLPQRPELKLIVTSATIDPERFSRHFDDAPIIQVSGRVFPVEVRYRPLTLSPDDYRDQARSGAPGAAGARGDLEPLARAATAAEGGEFAEPGPDFDGLGPADTNGGRPPGKFGRDFAREESEEHDRDLLEAVEDAIQELVRIGPGDILVFLPGEREIRDVSEYLRKSERVRAEILPLYGKLSTSDQARIFEAHTAQRVVLATNVAETSLTVPGVRYVIDSGLARISRYDPRRKVQRLPIEKISRASADQRRGRSGRTSAGVCIRLYSEEDYLSRPEYTPPEVQRTNLAAVILRMASLSLGDIDQFPFVEPPDSRAIRDGYHTLAELGAMDDHAELTSIGKKLARLPTDPRFGRMILAGQEHGSLAEVLVIAAALSVQDPRQRPFDAQARADQAHRAFADDSSDFLAYLKLWNTYHQEAEARSKNQLRKWCEEHYLSFWRMREWIDVHEQLTQLVREMGSGGSTPESTDRPQEAHGRRDAAPARGGGGRGQGHSKQQPAGSVSDATYASIHKALLTGLLSNVALQADDKSYIGARNTRLFVFPGTGISKKRPEWIVAGEIVETQRLYARTVARIDPDWIEPLADHIVGRSHFEPHWDEARGQVLAFERVTLYGLPVVKKRRIDFGRIDAESAHEIFVQSALVEGALRTHGSFFDHNLSLVAEIRSLEERLRRRDLLVGDDVIRSFYESRVPAVVHTAATFEKWRKEAEHHDPKLLWMDKATLLQQDPTHDFDRQFPETLDVGVARLAVSYRYAPGETEDGVTVIVPIALLHRVEARHLDWLVPGLLPDKIAAYFESLPRAARRMLEPVRARAEACAAALEPRGELVATMANWLLEEVGLKVTPDAFRRECIPEHLQMRICVVASDGSVQAVGRDLGRLQADWGVVAREAFTDAVRGHEKSDLTRWDFGTLAEVIELEMGNDPRGLAPSHAIGRRALAATGTDEHLRGHAGPSREHVEEQRPANGLSSHGGRSDPSGLSRHGSHSAAGGRDSAAGRTGVRVRAFPGLCDERGAISLRIFDSPEAAATAHRAGVRRLLTLRLAETVKQVGRSLPGVKTWALRLSTLGTAKELADEVMLAAVDRACLADRAVPRNEQEFERCVREGRGLLAREAAAISAVLEPISAEYHTIVSTLARGPGAGSSKTAAEIRDHLRRLVYRGFLLQTSWDRLAHYPRYLKAARLRLERLRLDPARDSARAQQIAPLFEAYLARAEQHARTGIVDTELERYRWMLEEWRVSVFAQELKTAEPVSLKRLEDQWTRVRGSDRAR